MFMCVTKLKLEMKMTDRKVSKRYEQTVKPEKKPNQTLQMVRKHMRRYLTHS